MLPPTLPKVSESMPSVPGLSFPISVHQFLINVSHSWTATPMIERFPSQFPDEVKTSVATVPMRRMAEMEEVADVIVFLGSRMGSFVCGAAVPVDGGFTAI